MKTPIISIITVTFNGGKTIESAIKSVLGQSYKNIEYIIVDGGSTDGTLEIVEKYKDRIAKFVSERDKGIYDGMNKGLNLATGDIIGILNSDDLYASDEVIKSVVEKMEEQDADVCWGDLVYVDDKDIDKVLRYWRSSNCKKGKFERGWMPPHPAFFVRKRVYEKYGKFDLDFRIAADYELMLRFLRKNNVKACYFPKILVKMRIGGESNKNIKNIIRANIECYKAWGKNGLEANFLTIPLKLLSKIPQYFKK
ncbi:MAG: glycosyltransferase family 2 protein [Candidatus Paceibacterota bacterium]|jgi:glycosyltransferase